MCGKVIASDQTTEWENIMAKRTKKATPVTSIDRIRNRGCGTYGQLEALAGVDDRVAFWKPYAHHEEQAREALHQLAAARLDAGVFSLI